MGLFKKSKQQLEKKAYRKIVAGKKTTAARQAYAEEAVKVAAERARAKARRPSFGEQLRARARGSVERRITGRRTAPIRRPVKRRTVRRYAPVKRRKAVRRYAPVKRRKAVRRYAPVKKRRTVRRKAPRRTTTTQEPRAAQTLNEAMYGGY